MAENGQKLGNYRYVSPKDFRGCLLVHGLFSNFSIGNFFHSYEFFKAIHILCQKTNGSGPILKKIEDMSYWTEMFSPNCPNQSLFVHNWKTEKKWAFIDFSWFPTPYTNIVLWYMNEAFGKIVHCTVSTSWWCHRNASMYLVLYVSMCSGVISILNWRV